MLLSWLVVLSLTLCLSLAAIILPVIFLAMTQRLPCKKKRIRQSFRSLPSRLFQIPKKRTKLLDWIETLHERKELAKQNFTNTDYAITLYNRIYQDESLTASSEPKFSDFYQPSALQKQGELIFVGIGALSLGYAAFRLL